MRISRPTTGEAKAPGGCSLGAYFNNYVMIKLKLKRKISGKAIRQAKRLNDATAPITVVSFEGVTTVMRIARHRNNKWYFRHNRPIGRRYPVSLYELKDINVYRAKELAEVFKKRKQFGKLKRLYRIQPEIDPKNIAKREHHDRVRVWQEKLKKNELLQLQNRRT